MTVWHALASFVLHSQLMTYTRFFGFFLLCGWAAVAYGQQPDAPAQEKAEKPKKELDEKKKKEEEPEAFGDFVKNVGLGLWREVKERLNLDETLESLEEKKNKILGDRSKKEESKDTKPKEPPEKPKDEGNSP